MHAYVSAMQMQCNYGAKHLKCYRYRTGWEAVGISLGGASLRMAILWVTRCTRSVELIDLYI
jgi:predicted alpha/beta-fold hydrolase